MPTMKSNQGSTPRSGLVLRRTWKPKDPRSRCCCCCGVSPSRRDMNRLSAFEHGGPFCMCMYICMYSVYMG